MKNLRERLAGRIHNEDIRELCLKAQGEKNDEQKERLYALTCDKDDKIAYNALWILTHFPASDIRWLYSRQQELIDRVMMEPHSGKKRLLLTLLERLPFEEQDLRADFIDFCLQRILSADETIGSKALCIKLAYKQCRYYDELKDELAVCLDMLSVDPMSPGIGTTRRNILKKLRQK